MIEGLDEIISQSKKKEDEKKVINISEFDKVYEAVYLELKTIVEETETQNNIDAFNQFHQTFLDTLEQVKISNQLIVDSEQLANRFSELNLILSKVLVDINFSLRKESNKSINHPFIPSYSCELKLKNYKLRGRINKNFRSPTFNDRFWISSGSIGNMNLRPESGTNKEIGLDFTSNTISLM